MTHKKSNNESSGEQNQISDFFSRATIPWEKSREEVWNELVRKTDSKPVPAGRTVKLHLIRYSVAASVLLLIGSALFIRFHTATIQTGNSQHLRVSLPDESVIELNSASTLKYNPLWFRISREVRFFEGEAYFEVREGSKFSVLSKSGITEIVGTSFNIYARKDRYSVTCITGKVKVTANRTDKHTLLTPHTNASVNAQGELDITEVKNVNDVVAWKDNMFVFTSRPLKDVFEEIERQYNVSVHSGIDADLLYTGNFSRETNIEDVLDMVCRPFGFQVRTDEEGNYTISD